MSRNDEIEIVREIAPQILTNTNTVKGISFTIAAKIIHRALKSRKIAKKKILLYEERKKVKESDLYKSKMKELEHKALQLSPEVEERSVMIENQSVIFFPFFF